MRSYRKPLDCLSLSIFVILGFSILTVCLRSHASTPKSLGYLLFRLPGANRVSCAHCHDFRTPPRPNPSPYALQKHFKSAFGPISKHDYSLIKAFIENSTTEAQAIILPDKKLVESLRSLGYIQYQSQSDFRRLDSLTVFNAFVLESFATGNAALRPSPKSPTGKVLRFVSWPNLCGIVLSPSMATAGKYKIYISGSGVVDKKSNWIFILDEDKRKSIDVKNIRWLSDKKGFKVEGSWQVLKSSLLTIGFSLQNDASFDIEEVRLQWLGP